MEDSAYDIMAQFWLPGGDVIRGESTLYVDPADPLIGKDYIPATSSAYYSNFFEVSAFSFNMTNEPSETGARMSQGGGHTHAAVHAALVKSGGTGHSASAVHSAVSSMGQATDPFKRWRSATDDQARKMRWQLNFDTFKLTRFVDGGSPIFFQLCGTQATFEKASLVKRVSQMSGNRVSQAFMRFDFKQLMLKNIEWSDGDMVTEQFTFVCNEFTFKYRQQKADGTLEGAGTPADWKRDRDSKRAPGDNKTG